MQSFSVFDRLHEVLMNIYHMTGYCKPGVQNLAGCCYAEAAGCDESAR